MSFWDIMADDEMFDRLLCLIVVGGFFLVWIVRSFKGDDDL